MQRDKIFYGWVIVFAAGVMLFVNVGLAMHCFSTFSPYLVSLRNFNFTQISFLATLRSVTSIAGLTFLNGYYKKLGMKKGVALSSATCIIGMSLYAYAESYALMVVATLICGISVALCGLVASAILVNRWFVSKKALALSLCSIGSGIPSMIMPPFISKWVQIYSLKTAFLYVAAIMAVGSLISVILIKDNPQEIGLTAYDDGSKDAEKTITHPKSKPSKGVLYMFYISIMLIAVGSSCTNNLTLLYTGSGFSALQAAKAMSLWGLALTISKLFYGYFTDKIGIRKSNYIYLYGAAAALGLCVMTYTGKAFFMYASVIAIGVSFPFATVGTSLWAGAVFPEKDYERSYKNVQLAISITTCIISLAMGRLADFTGSYVFVFAVYTAAMLVGTSILQIVLKKV